MTQTIHCRRILAPPLNFAKMTRVSLDRTLIKWIMNKSEADVHLTTEPAKHECTARALGGGVTLSNLFR